jgi:hypothetical protein
MSNSGWLATPVSGILVGMHYRDYLYLVDLT